MMDLARTVKPDEATCFVLPNGPVNASGDIYFWYRKKEDVQTTRDAIVELIETLKSRNANAKIYLGGFSQGGGLATYMLYSGNVEVDGYLLFAPSIRADGMNYKSEQTPRVFVAHGERDASCPIERSEKMVEQLKGLKLNVDFYPYDDFHVVSRAAMGEARKFLGK